MSSFFMTLQIRLGGILHDAVLCAGRSMPAAVADGQPQELCSARGGQEGRTGEEGPVVRVTVTVITAAVRWTFALCSKTASEEVRGPHGANARARVFFTGHPGGQRMPVFFIGCRPPCFETQCNAHCLHSPLFEPSNYFAPRRLPSIRWAYMHY